MGEIRRGGVPHSMRRTQWTAPGMGIFSPPALLAPALEVLRLGAGLGGREGGCDWGTSLPTSPTPPPALSLGLQGLPGPGERSCWPHSPQAWLLSRPWEPQVGTRPFHLYPPVLFHQTSEPVLISSCPPPVPLTPQMSWEVAPSRMTQLSPWDPNYEPKTGSHLVWVSRECLWLWLGVGQGCPGSGLKLQRSFLTLHRGPALGLASPSQAGPCVIPPSGHCTRQPQAGATGPWPPRQDIRMASPRPGMQVISLGALRLSPMARCAQGTGIELPGVGTPSLSPQQLLLPRVPGDML